MNINFLPSNIVDRNITGRLQVSLETCKSVTGSIAYWSLGIGAINHQLLRALGKPNSSMCVDLQWPTDLKNIAGIVNSLREYTDIPVMYICLRKNLYSRETVSKLHTKLLVFDMGDGNWEIWTGSHNFTDAALKGGNLEAMILIQGHVDDPQFEQILCEVQDYLTGILRFCEPFDPQKIAYYEALRGTPNDKNLVNAQDYVIARVLSLRSELADQLAGETIILLGNLSEELSHIQSRNRGGSEVYLRIKDIDSGIVYTYKAKIRPSDLIDNASSSNVSFNDRRWAVRKASRKGQSIAPPILQDKINVDNRLIRDNKYYINIELKELIEKNIHVTYYTYPDVKQTALWREEADFQSEPDFDLHLLLGQANSIMDSKYLTERKTKKRANHSLVPVENAVELTRARPIEWTDHFEDGLFDKQIIVFE